MQVFMQVFIVHFVWIQRSVLSLDICMGFASEIKCFKLSKNDFKNTQNNLNHVHILNQFQAQTQLIPLIELNTNLIKI
jgi:hypothetical protein